jgi:hypothetical protein
MDTAGGRYGDAESFFNRLPDITMRQGLAIVGFF